jgi:hypothetical protein
MVEILVAIHLFRELLVSTVSAEIIVSSDRVLILA